MSIITLVKVCIYPAWYIWFDRSLRFRMTFWRHLTLLIMRRPMLLPFLFEGWNFAFCVMLNNIRIIPPNLNEQFRDMWISHMSSMRSAWDTAHVNSVCAFACPLPLWPERVVTSRASLSSVSSGCAKLLLVESGYPDMFFVTISLGFARFFMNTLDRLLWFFLSSTSCTDNLLFEFFLQCRNLHCC